MDDTNIMDRIFNNIDKLTNYVDFDYSKETENNFYDYITEKYLKDIPYNDLLEIESKFYDALEAREKQGFIYGFRLATELFSK